MRTGFVAEMISSEVGGEGEQAERIAADSATIRSATRTPPARFASSTSFTIVPRGRRAETRDLHRRQPLQWAAVAPTARARRPACRCISMEPAGDRRRASSSTLRRSTARHRRRRAPAASAATSASNVNTASVIRNRFGGGPSAEPECCVERLPLRRGEHIHAFEERQERAGAARVAELHLRLDAGDPCDLKSPCGLDGVLEECRLADPRLAAQHEHATHTVLDCVEQAVDRLTLFVPTHQRWHVRSLSG